MKDVKKVTSYRRRDQKIKKYFWVAMLMNMLFSKCAIFSFSGSSVSKKNKNFSLEIYNDAVKGPPNLIDEFVIKLTTKILQQTHLKQVENNGDVRFEGSIKVFEEENVNYKQGAEKTESDRVRVKISVELSYVNPHNKEFEFQKKFFSAYEDLNQEEANQENPEVINKILEKIIDDILRNSISNW